jgi:hypothetical protein
MKHKIICNSITCICGHKDNRHKDTGIFNGWGQGSCELCRCSFFECNCLNNKSKLIENFNEKTEEAYDYFSERE